VIRAVFFDVGETLVDETRAWEDHARRLGVPRLTLMGVLGGLIARGEGHEKAFELVAPGRGQGRGQGVTRTDLYADALPCLEELARRGVGTGIAGNWPEEQLRGLDLPVRWLASPATLGARKPDLAFFHALVARTGYPAHEVAYVGDRIDFDVLPAADAGLVPVFLRRGPWGILQDGQPGTERARLRLTGLAELPDALSQLRAGTGGVSPA
jgi:FMN phosphatase YigB (HAD superfamily)